MKSFYHILFFGWMGAVSIGISSAQDTNPISRLEIEEMTQASQPETNSPFFIEREEAREAIAEAARNPIYRNSLLLPRHSFQEEMKKMMHGFLVMTKVFPNKTIPPAVQIFVEPSSFSISETPEISVSCKITNTTKEILFIDFATNQRIEIVVKESNGTPVMRWSDDRSFDPITSIVTINPRESILYTEKIPTAIMKNGSKYLLEVSLIGHAEYTRTELIFPQDPYFSSSHTPTTLHE